MDPNIEAGPAQAISRFNTALVRAGESQRALMQEIGQFARDESLRFVSLRLERTGVLIDKLSTGQGVGGLFAAQQEWLHDLVADYAARNMRMMDAMRGMLDTAVAQAADAAGETAGRVQAQAQDHLHTAAQDMEQRADQTQETQH